MNVRMARSAREKKRELPEEVLAFRLTAAGLPPCVRQYRFATRVGREYKADFAWPNDHLLVEVNGGLHLGSRGGHTSFHGRYRDQRKLNIATLLGFRVLEFAPCDVQDNTALFEIEAALGLRSLGTWIAFETAMTPARMVAEGTRRLVK